MNSNPEKIKIYVCVGGAWELINGNFHYLPKGLFKRSLNIRTDSNFSSLLTSVAIKFSLNVNSGFKLTYKSGDDLIEISDDDDASDFVTYVMNNHNVKVTLFVVGAIGSDGDQFQNESNQLGSDAQPLHNLHTQDIDVQTGNQFQQNTQSHYGHDTHDYQYSQYHYGNSANDYQNSVYDYGNTTYDTQNSQPFTFPKYDYSLDEGVEYVYEHDQKNDFQVSEHHHEQNQQNDFQNYQSFTLPEYDYSLDEDVEYISTNDSDERFLIKNDFTDWYCKPTNDQDLSDEEKSREESSESSDDEDNPLLQVPEDVFWNMPPIPPTPAPFKPPSKPLRYNPSELVKLRDVFENKEKLKIALGLKCVKEGFKIKVKRSNKTRFEAECKFEKCEWFLAANKIKYLESFVVKTLTDRHTCPKTQIHPNHPQANKKVLACLIKEALQDPSRKYTGRDIVTDMRVNHNISISYQQAWRAREYAITQIRGTPEESFAQLPIYLHNLAEQNPGTITRITRDREKRFELLFVALGESVRVFKIFFK